MVLVPPLFWGKLLFLVAAEILLWRNVICRREEKSENSPLLLLFFVCVCCLCSCCQQAGRKWERKKPKVNWTNFLFFPFFCGKRRYDWREKCRRPNPANRSVTRNSNTKIGHLRFLVWGGGGGERMTQKKSYAFCRRKNCKIFFRIHSAAAKKHFQCLGSGFFKCATCWKLFCRSEKFSHPIELSRLPPKSKK